MKSVKKWLIVFAVVVSLGTIGLGVFAVMIGVQLVRTTIESEGAKRIATDLPAQASKLNAMLRDGKNRFAENYSRCATILGEVSSRPIESITQARRTFNELVGMCWGQRSIETPTALPATDVAKINN